MIYHRPGPGCFCKHILQKGGADIFCTSIILHEIRPALNNNKLYHMETVYAICYVFLFMYKQPRSYAICMYINPHSRTEKHRAVYLAVSNPKCNFWRGGGCI